MKNFDDWNQLKKNIDSKKERRFYHTKEIWWCYLGKNIGREQDGYGENFSRPVLILKEFSKETCLIVPLTTSKNKHKFRISIGISTAILSQIRVIDTKRLIKRLSIIDQNNFDLIRNALRLLI